MKAITASPETIREIFSKKYTIPDFQRPYSWDNEPCEKLWDDIIDFHNQKKGKDDKYFLGNVIINPGPESAQGAWEVVDGQQRLTTLLLLIKALHLHAGTVKALEECLRIKDPLTSELTDEIRVVSFAISEDKENLHSVILNNFDNIPKCNLLSNFELFRSKIDEWWTDNGQSAEALHSFILVLLDNVVLLPIHCDSEDDALTIFETINNRGMSLSDADIFKAKLYHNTPQGKQGAFIEEWNALTYHDWLFRVLMHIVRAKAGDSSKEIGMRSFFTTIANPLHDSTNTLTSLKIINAIGNEWYGNDEINSLWGIMNTYPNYYWNFPLFVFLHKYGVFDDTTNEFELAEDYAEQFLDLLKATVRYFFIKGIVHNSVNAVRDTVYRVCVSIEKEKDWLADYSAHISKSDCHQFSISIKTNQLKRYQRGIVLLSAYLNPHQNKKEFSAFVSSKYDIEHILPKKWNNYDGWTDDLWEEKLNTLGNLIPLTKSQNIAAKNEFFDKKKKVYKKSSIRDAQDLLDILEWTPEALEAKHNEKVIRLKTYFQIE